MKRLFKIFIIIFSVILMTGCAKKIDKLSYASFNEFFSGKDNYEIKDRTKNFDINIRKYIEAGNGKIQILYIEFANEKYADDYINTYYKKSENTKIKKYKTYTYIKSNKNVYMKSYKVDNVIVTGISTDKKNKKQLNKILKELGY